MEVTFTPSQQKVIDLRDCDILVSAAAGSGKTAVLVERIIRRVLDEKNPIDIDRILVLTFTNAAAGEMKERIRVAIMKELQKNPSSEHLQRQATLIHNAQITTMHSFNLFLVRNHFNEIGIDPAFRIAEEGELKLLSAEVLETLLEEEYEKREEDFVACLKVFGGSEKQDALVELIMQLSKMAGSYPWPELWLEERKQDYHADTVEELLSGPIRGYWDKYCDGILRDVVATYNKAITLAQEPDGPYMYGELLDKERDIVQAWLEEPGFENRANRMLHYAFDRISSKRDDSVNAEKRALAKNLRDKAKEMISALCKDFFATPLSLALSQSQMLEGPTCKLLELTQNYLKRMAEAKAERKIIDFNDMEHFALNILLKVEEGEIVPTQVAREYQSYFEEIMTDEYQDSNLVQEYILNALSSGFNRFMVGDVKQSIYRFRLARPELFLEKLQSFEDEGNKRKVVLSQNFRSRVEVLNAVNDVFEQVMTKETGGILYDTDAKLYLGAKYPEYESAGAEMIFVNKPEKEDELEDREAEINAIGDKISWLLHNYKVTDKETGELRETRFSDIVILTRSVAKVEELYKKLLGERGIPVYTESKKGYFETTEIRTLLNVLKVLDNPLQEIPLYGVMKSVFGGFTEEEIALLRSKDKSRSLYEDLLAKEDQPKVKQFVAFLKRYRFMVSYMPIRELLEHLVEEVDYLNYVTALPLGAKRRANVEMLFTKASEFGKMSYFGLFHFVRYIEKLQEYDQDFGEADLLDENAQLVRLMSIHKSKGLEFPITIVSGLDYSFNDTDSNKGLIMDMDLGLGVRYQNATTRVRNHTLRQRVIQRKLREEARAEELRVLYVAMTRAKEKLILTAVQKDAKDLCERIMREEPLGFTYMDFVTANSYLDFLLPVLKKCRIEVSWVDAKASVEAEIRDTEERLERRMQLQNAETSEEIKERVQALKERLNSVYGHADLEGLMAKTTVSELKIAAMVDKDEEAYHAFEEREVETYIPAFCREQEEVTGTVRGNAYHRVMELFDFEKVLQDIQVDSYEAYKASLQENLLKDKVTAHLDALAQSGILQAEYRNIIRINKITGFILSELGFRMWKAQERKDLYREQPFVLGVSARKLQESFPEDEQVLIQGIIDAYFIEDDKIILLDYKTDTVPTLESLWTRYETQIEYYTQALERLLGKPVSEKYLYSFSLEQY